MFWTLARDDATPFSHFFSKVSKTYRNPFNSIVFCAVIVTVLGLIYLGSSTAFSAFVGSFAILGFLSYICAILPHILNFRRGIEPGPFWMGKWLGLFVNAIACAFIMAFTVIFCFPFALPVDAKSMNYACLISGGLTVFVAAWWIVRRKTYQGPKYVSLEAEMLAEDAI